MYIYLVVNLCSYWDDHSFIHQPCKVDNTVTLAPTACIQGQWLYCFSIYSANNDRQMSRLILDKYLTYCMVWIVCLTTEHKLRVRLPTWHSMNRHVSLSTRDLPSFDIRFEFESDVLIRFDSIRKWRADFKISNHRACHVCCRTINNTRCSTTNFNRFGVATGIYIKLQPCMQWQLSTPTK